jgi:uncharacterized metal-binding protein YceD (DUF177 family)
MPIKVNLRHLEAHNIDLEGELPVEELDLDMRDEMVQASKALEYKIEVQNVEDALLAQGQLKLPLNCECVRCLKAFEFALQLEHWTALLPLTGDEAVPVVSDCVDLTPYVREDILLELPQHPLCDPECGGLPKPLKGKKKADSTSQIEGGSTAWSELNKLKFK